MCLRVCAFFFFGCSLTGLRLIGYDKHKPINTLMCVVVNVYHGCSSTPIRLVDRSLFCVHFPYFVVVGCMILFIALDKRIVFSTSMKEYWEAKSLARILKILI